MSAAPRRIVRRSCGRTTVSRRFLALVAALPLAFAVMAIAAVPSSPDAVESVLARTVTVAAPHAHSAESAAPMGTAAKTVADRADATDAPVAFPSGDRATTVIHRVTSLGAIRARAPSRWIVFALLVVLATALGLRSPAGRPLRVATIAVPPDWRGRPDASRAPPSR